MLAQQQSRIISPESHVFFLPRTFHFVIIFKDLFPVSYFLISDVSGFFLQCVADITIFIFLQTPLVLCDLILRGSSLPDNIIIDKLN